jgi:hypothetical protein
MKEMAEVWERMKGKEGEEMRKRMEEVREVVKRSWRAGKSREVMMGMERYF